MQYQQQQEESQSSATFVCGAKSSLSSSPDSTITTNNKSVRFCAAATMQLTLHIDDYTDEEIGACYYADYDYYAFKQDVRITRQMMEEQHVLLDEINFSLRGLESFTKQGMKAKQNRRRAAYQAVAKEQLEQFLLQEEAEDEFEAYMDDEAIAAVYGNAVCESVTMAYLAGLADELVVAQSAKSSNAVGMNQSYQLACINKMLIPTYNKQHQQRRLCPTLPRSNSSVDGRNRAA